MCFPFRTRRPENIIEEIRHHVERYEITHLEFNDLLCNGNLYQLERLCELLIDCRIDVRWISYAAVRKNMTDALMDKMKKAGCNSLCYGIESGSDAVLKRMNKHYTRKDAGAVLKKTHQAGIEPRVNIIVGFPGESRDDFQQTLDFIYENRKYIAQVTNVSSFVFMPGADLGIYPHKFGIKFLDPDNPGKWTDENGLTQGERNERVKEVCRCLKQLGIENLIVNDQPDFCPEQCIPEKKKLSVCGIKGVSEVKTAPAGKHDGKGQNRKSQQKLKKTGILLCLFIFSLIIDFYLTLLKKIRGSIIFPGS
jgi:hypothetical protein